MRLPGANVSTGKKELSKTESDILSFLFDFEDAATALWISNRTDYDIRDTASALSRLVGMDLIVSTEYQVILTDAEKLSYKTIPQPLYFIRKKTNDIYNRRAYNVLKATKGSLHNLEYIQPGEEQKLWPLRPMTQIEFVGLINGFDGAIVSFVVDNADAVSPLNDSVGKPVRVTVEFV